MFPDHVGLHTSSGQGSTQRDERVGSVNRGVEGVTESQGDICNGGIKKEGRDGQNLTVGRREMRSRSRGREVQRKRFGEAAFLTLML